ncbi:hypothetical protein [Paenibacillus sambharensis]|nr:hypothetical protein [Paenibacillus sambharensis]
MNMTPHYQTVSQLMQDVDTLEVGDPNELSYDVVGELWREIQGDSNDCLSEESPHFESCFIQQARTRLKAADIIVSNHTLFFTDFYLKQKGMYGLFPEYEAVIFDEGHRIKDVFSKCFQKVGYVKEIENLFDRCLNKRSQWAKAVFEDVEADYPELPLKQAPS